jgi:hypothetical protein
MASPRTKITVNVDAALLQRARTITGRGVTQTITAALEALDRQQRRTALRRLRGRVRIDLDLDATRR